MKKTVSLHDFRDAFRLAGRMEDFSYEGQGLLFDYLEEYESGSGEELELDVIALCCEYGEDSIGDIAANYDIDLAGQDDDQARETVRDYLNENTSVVGETSEGFVYALF